MRNPQVSQFESIEKKGVGVETFSSLLEAVEANDVNGEGGRALEEAARQIQIVADHGNDQERSAFLAAVRQKLGERKFQQEELKHINANLESLKQRVAGNDKARGVVDAIKVPEPTKAAEKIPDVPQAMPPVSVEQPKNAVPEPQAKSVSEGSPQPARPTNVPEQKKLLPDTWDVRKWTSEQVAIASAVTLGGVGLVALLYHWFGKKEQPKSGNEAEQQSIGSRIFSWLKWIPIVGLVGLGFYGGHQYLMKQSEWYRKKYEEIESKVKEWKKPIETAGTVAVVAGGVAAGMTNEAGRLARGAGEITLNAAATTYHAAQTLLEYCQGGNVEGALESLKQSGGAFFESGKGFFCWWGKELVRLPQEYVAQWSTYITKGDNRLALGTVVGEFGVMYVFNAAMLRAILTGQISKPTWGTLGRVIGAPEYLLKDGYNTVHILTRDRSALKVKLGGIAGRRYFLERIAVGHAQRFAETGAIDDLRLAVQRWQDFDNEISTAEQRMGKGLGMHFDEDFIRSIRVKQGKIADAIQEAMEARKELPKDTPRWVRRLWTSKEASSPGFAKILENPGPDFGQAVAKVEINATESVVAGKIGPKPSPSGASAAAEASEARAANQGGPARRLQPKPHSLPGETPKLSNAGPKLKVVGSSEAVAEGATAKAARKAPLQIGGEAAGRALHGAPIVVGAGLGMAWEKANMDKAIADAEGRQLGLIGELDRLYFMRDESGKRLIERETKADGTVEYVLPGVEDVKISVGQVRELHNKTDAKAAGWASMGVEAGAAGVFLLPASGGLAIPVIVTALAAKAAIYKSQEAIEKGRRRQFIREAPVWLLAMLGTAKVFQSNELSEFSVLEENAGGVVHNVDERQWSGSPHPMTMHLANMKHQEADTARQKREVREKLFQTMAFREFMKLHDELLPELPGGGDVRLLFKPDGEFLKEGGDYHNFVRKFAVLQLLAKCKGHPVKLEDIEALDFTVTGGDFIDRYRLFNGIDVTQALRRGMLFYVQHMREKRYKEALKQTGGDAKIIEQLNHAIALQPEHTFVFNVHPKNLPTLAGEETYAERLLRERYAAVQSGGSDVPSLAASGYGVPGSPGTENGLEHFLLAAVDPKFKEAQRANLERYAARQNTELPIPLPAMDGWGSAETFRTAFGERIKRYRQFNEGLEKHALKSEENMRAFADTFTSEELQDYLQFQKHRDFYDEYLLWRTCEDMRIPEDYSSLASLMLTWKSKGKVQLLDEKLFAAAQRGVQSLSAGQESILPKRLMNEERVELSAPTLSLAGYDPRKHGQVLFTLDGFNAHGAEMQKFQEQQAQSRIRLLQPDADKSQSFRPFTANAVARGTASPESKPEDPIAVLAIDQAGQRKPLLSLAGHDLSRCIAVPEQHLPEFLASWKKNDGFDDLRMQILRYRVFVYSSPH